MITGITPQLAQARGVTEAEFARRIHALFTVENTCVVGYNNVRFDDEVTRNIFIATLRSLRTELAERQFALGSAGCHARLLRAASRRHQLARK